MLVEEVVAMTVRQAMQDGLQAQHRQQAEHQDEAHRFLPSAQVLGVPDTAAVGDLPFAVVLEGTAHMVHHHPAHAATIDEAAAAEDRDPKPEPAGIIRSVVHPMRIVDEARLVGFLPARLVQVVEDCLRAYEDDHREEEPGLPAQEGQQGRAGPDQVRDHGDHRVTHDSGVSMFRQPPNRLREASLCVHHEVLDVKVHPALAPRRRPRPPDEAVEQRRQQPGRVSADPFDDVGVPLEQGVHAVVVPVPIGPNR
mmetsp:Transcript_89166/g.257062  ORF Transcript_89166/g.257062 Transcript_89166/m.257062 type:complete len:253 (-) Transcript_89166:53-811(-)